MDSVPGSKFTGQTVWQSAPVHRPQEPAGGHRDQHPALQAVQHQSGLPRRELLLGSGAPGWGLHHHPPHAPRHGDVITFDLGGAQSYV